MIVANPTSPLHPLHSIQCHPERSEGSAFDFSPVCVSANVDAVDAASSLSPLSATHTKKHPGGGTSQAPPKNFNRNPSVFNCFSPKSFTMRTYAKHTCNPFRMRTSKTQHLKSFRIRTYEKMGGGGGTDFSLVHTARLPELRKQPGAPSLASPSSAPALSAHRIVTSLRHYVVAPLPHCVNPGPRPLPTIHYSRPQAV
jgi:hypothetical protein